MENPSKLQKATVILFPSRFQISGPFELIVLTQTIVRSTSDEEDIKYQVEQAWTNWYVPCAVTDKPITLDQLKYWDVDLQECYSSPDLVPNRFWHLPHDPRPELREYWAKRSPERIADVLEAGSADQERSPATGNGDNQGRHVEASDLSGDRDADRPA